MDRSASRILPKAATLGLNTLTESQRVRLLRLADSGLSFRAIERLTGHRRETISRYVRRPCDRESRTIESRGRTVGSHLSDLRR